jgi:hypothetical protein
VLVKDPELVDYERQTVMLVEVRVLWGVGDWRPWGQSGPDIAACFSVFRLWPLTRSARTFPSPW